MWGLTVFEFTVLFLTCHIVCNPQPNKCSSTNKKPVPYNNARKIKVLVTFLPQTFTIHNPLLHLCERVLWLWALLHVWHVCSYICHYIWERCYIWRIPHIMESTYLHVVNLVAKVSPIAVCGLVHATTLLWAKQVKC
jgi:hypothetical protein